MFARELRVLVYCSCFLIILSTLCNLVIGVNIVFHYSEQDAKGESKEEKDAG